MICNYRMKQTQTNSLELLSLRSGFILHLIEHVYY